MHKCRLEAESILVDYRVFFVVINLYIKMLAAIKPAVAVANTKYNNVSIVK